jgi:hypothetical protein
VGNLSRSDLLSCLKALLPGPSLAEDLSGVIIISKPFRSAELCLAIARLIGHTLDIDQAMWGRKKSRRGAIDTEGLLLYRG